MLQITSPKKLRKAKRIVNGITQDMTARTRGYQFPIRSTVSGEINSVNNSSTILSPPNHHRQTTEKAR